jgi:mannose-6-phosphate isomerase
MFGTKLLRKPVEKVWGRCDLPNELIGELEPDQPIGEVWYEAPNGVDAPLLVKYLFTSEKLSIQVHPDDTAARSAGGERGKDEAWVILRADPGAVIGLGLTGTVSAERLVEAARDGTIEQMVDWRPVAAGECYYLPAGTIHALGPGLTLIEIQQNSDVTYRLYDYGRGRELHLEQAIKVAVPRPFRPVCQAIMRSDAREILASGQAFVLERWREANGTIRPGEHRPVWLIPVTGEYRIGLDRIVPGDVWVTGSPQMLAANSNSELLVAYPGPDVIEQLIS